MQTEAAVLWEPGGPWTVQEVDLGAPVAGEVLVELAASGICHTDGLRAARNVRGRVVYD